jgi:hypothetical protein
MHWRVIWELWHTRAFPIGTSAVGSILAVYYGYKHMDETYYWYWFKFRDRPVYDVLTQRVKGKHYGRGFNMRELTSATGREESSVLKSLKRLRNMERAIETDTGWFAK